MPKNGSSIVIVAGRQYVRLHDGSLTPYVRPAVKAWAAGEW